MGYIDFEKDRRGRELRSASRSCCKQAKGVWVTDYGRPALPRHDERLFGRQPGPRPPAHPQGHDGAGLDARGDEPGLLHRTAWPLPRNALSTVTGLDMALPMNTGAEAVETAIKAARRWGYRFKNIPKDRAEIIVARQQFPRPHHDDRRLLVRRPTATASDPFAGGFKSVPFGDAEAAAAAITDNTCAILIEPIQGEAGIVVPPEAICGTCARICDERGVLLILDEVQSGLGRTGAGSRTSTRISGPTG